MNDREPTNYIIYLSNIREGLPRNQAKICFWVK